MVMQTKYSLVAEVLNEPALLRLAERWRGEDFMMAAAAGAAVPMLALQGIAAVGFTGAGVAAGWYRPFHIFVN
jgi:hypothetical protein